MKNMNLSKVEILERIGYFRNKKNISAYRLGMELGHSKTYFYRVESGEITLTVDILLDVLDILGVTTAQFFYPDLNKFDKDQECLKSMETLTEEEKNSLFTILKIRK